MPQRSKRAKCCYSTGKAPFLWLNHQGKQLPVFTDQASILEHTALKASRYRMLQAKRGLQGQRLQEQKIPSFSEPPAQCREWRKSLYDGNPCSSSPELALSRLSVFWTASCLRLQHLDGNAPLFIISIFSELVEAWCTVGSHSASVERPLRTDLASKVLPGHFSVRGRRIHRWK